MTTEGISRGCLRIDAVRNNSATSLRSPRRLLAWYLYQTTGRDARARSERLGGNPPTDGVQQAGEGEGHANSRSKRQRTGIARGSRFHEIIWIGSVSTPYNMCSKISAYRSSVPQEHTRSSSSVHHFFIFELLMPSHSSSRKGWSQARVEKGGRLSESGKYHKRNVASLGHSSHQFLMNHNRNCKPNHHSP